MAGKVPARLNVMTLGVRDFAKMKRFYEALGWPSQSVGGEWVGFETGGAMLALYPLDALAEEANLPPDEMRNFAGFTCAVNVEEKGMVDVGIETAREAGGRSSPSRPSANGADTRDISPTPRGTYGR
ncbi:MAG: hypothetical protein M3494_18670 [Actinomycetota bacterium]|nr:hypothetical protein [Actinomycetota bacterium]